MAGRNVNVFVTNWRWTGKDVRAPQAAVDIELYWKDNAGTDHEWSGVATFPNDLQLMPVAWVKEALEQLLLRAIRKRLEIDN